MRGNPGQENFEIRRDESLSLDLEADWSYLRANLDHPGHRMGSKLGSGLAAWLSRRLHASAAPPPQLSILARIALGPRQSLALVEAEGVHVLVGTSADGTPSFFSLSGHSGRDAHRMPEGERSLFSASVSSAERLGRSDAPDMRMPGSRPGSRTGSQSDTQGGYRHLSRPRLTGRVSWV